MAVFYLLLFNQHLFGAETRIINSTKYDDVFPDDYDKFEAPIVQENPVQVYVALSILDIDSINEETMDFNIQMYLNEIWKDPRLNLTRFKAKKSTLFPHSLRDLIWSPDLIFDNAKGGELFKLSVPNTGTRVLYGGEFYRSSRYNLKISCQMHLQFYPMDTQKCFMKISFFSNPDHKAELHWCAEDGSAYRVTYPRSIHFTHGLEPLKYLILLPTAYKETEVWASGNYTYLYANFTFVRRLSGNLVNMYIPSTLVVILSWLSFWLDVTAVPARITLGVTSLLTLATQVVQARSLLPPVNYMTALDIWLFVCILMVFSSIIEYAVAYHVNFYTKQIHQAGNDARASSSKVDSKKPINGGRKISNAFDEQHPPNNAKSVWLIVSMKCKRVSRLLRQSTSSLASLDSLCRRVFPLTFLTFCAFYWSFFMLVTS